MTTQTAIYDPPASVEQDDASSGEVAFQIDAARAAQSRWSQVSLKERLRVVRQFRHAIVEHSEPLCSAVTYPSRNGIAETLAGELIPLADACRFMEKQAGKILAPRRLSRRGRPMWLRGVSVELRREPFGVVLIVGASNYPLFLPGVQALQALVAGNAVLIKPGAGATRAAIALQETFAIARLDPSLVHVLPEDPQSVEAAVAAGVNKVVLTGSANTGRQVQSLLARSLTPSVMELSGCDAVFVLETADFERVARCLAFGLRFNGSGTCIAPRRVFVPRQMQTSLADLLLREMTHVQREAPAIPSTDSRVTELVSGAVRDGARVIAGGVATLDGCSRLAGPTILADASPRMKLLQADVFAPVLSLVPVESVEAALIADRECPYALGAVVFGEGGDAFRFAERVDAGCVVINDLIAPTADPRVPFGGRGQSGFGVTRGGAGLEEMTQLKAVIHQQSRWLPHLEDTTPHDGDLLSCFLGMSHGRSWPQRVRSGWSAIRAALRQRRWTKKLSQNLSERHPRPGNTVVEAKLGLGTKNQEDHR